MIKRLVSFGCSNTFGDGLPDVGIYNVKKNMPTSTYSWPCQLAKKLNLDLCNKGISGASNREIFYEICNFDFNQNDLIIVNWTFIERDCIIFSNNKIDQIGSWINTKSSKAFFKHLYSHENQLVSLFNYANLAYLLLKEKNIKNYHSLIMSNYRDFIPKWNVVNYMPFYLHDISHNFPKAIDNLHPGIQAHEEYSKKLFVEINKIIDNK